MYLVPAGECMRFRWVFNVLSALTIAAPVLAAETTTYTYDELGRLVGTSNSGGPRTGKTTATAYDPAGNRSAHAVGQPLPPPTNAAVFSISAPPAVSEGGVSNFTVTKTGTATSTLTVNFATANGTAVAPGDYTATSGTLSFLFWETAKAVPVSIIDDGIAEGAEQFSMTLSSPSSGATLGTATANGSINASSAANLPPVANPDSATVPICTFKTTNVVANDTDPEGNTPLVVTAVGGGTLGSTSVSGTTSVKFTAYGGTGAEDITYTVRDSLGATSTGVLTVTVTNGTGCM